MFPLFHEPKFLEELYSGVVSSSLIILMMSLASRYSVTFADDESLSLTVERIEQEIEQKEMGPTNTLLNDIKLACLCMIHQLASGPNQRTWRILEQLAQFVYGCGLHKVDSSTQAMECFPGSSLEELRYVWWTVVKIDNSCNLLSCTSFRLDVETATTSSVSTSISDFTAGVEPARCCTHIPRSGDATSWKLYEDASNASLADGQRLQLSMFLLIREGGILLRGILRNPADRALEASMLLLHQNCTWICSVLPAWYMAPQRAAEAHETPTRHRIRLDALLQLRMYAAPPSCPDDCVTELTGILVAASTRSFRP